MKIASRVRTASRGRTASRVRGQRRLAVAVLAAATPGVVPSPASAQTDDIAELRRQVEQLQQQIRAVEARQAEGVTQAVTADAERRTTLDPGRSETFSGYKGGFFIQSADGNFSLKPGFQFQFRSVTNFGPDAEGDDFQDAADGFEIRRMKVEFKGNAFAKELEYSFRLSVNRNGGEAVLDNAFIKYSFPESPFYTIVGQFKDNVFHEESVSSGRQLTVDRSLANEQLGGGLTDFVQGVVLGWEPDESPLRAEIAYLDGLSTGNTRFFDGDGGAGGLEPNFGVSGRVEYALLGDFGQYRDFTALGNEQDSLVLGGGVHFSQAGSDDLWLHTIDLSWKPAAVTGLGVYGAYYGSYRDPAEGSLYDYGALIQAGYVVAEQWEPFARYNFVTLDEDFVTADGGTEDTYHEITAGVNYYLQKHAAKVTFDATYLPNGSPGGSGIGHVSSTDDQFVIRGQFQLLL